MGGKGYQVQGGERRQVSVLFTDMAGYTAMVESMGEEQALPFTRKIHDMLTQVVLKHGGTVRSFAGDSIMAVFGVPTALEDAALRACRAALAIHAVFDATGDRLHGEFGVRPKMRVGISSGISVMAPVQGDDAAVTAVGTVVNLASRVQALASAGQSLICDATRRQVEWQTKLAFEGEHTIKGLTKAQKLWQLRAVYEGVTRFDASLARGLSPLVGRDVELDVLTEALERARQSLQVVDLVGEPGLGKSRLVFEFSRRALAAGGVVLSGYCVSDGQNVPFLPFLEAVRGAFRLRADDDPGEVEQKLGMGLHTAGLYSNENLGLMLNLFGLPAPDTALDGLDGVLVGLRTRDLLPALLHSLASQRRVVLLIEDIHWIDGVSQDLLQQLVTDAEHASLMILTTRRPEHVPAWKNARGVTSIALRPLAVSDLQTLIQGRLGVDGLPNKLVTHVAERAEGNPLFGEEILSLLLQQGSLQIEGGKVIFAANLGEIGLPVGVQNLLTARIDRLQPDDRALLQAAAVIGRRFDPGLLAMIGSRPEETGSALQRLQDRELVSREVDSSDYAFRHVLLRDTVYQGLLSTRREALHLAVALALEQRSGNRIAEMAETLANHFTLANRLPQAFAYTAMAGAKALGTFSVDEADQYFAAALAIYERDPHCTDDEQFGVFVANYGLCLNISMRVRTMLDVADKVGPVLKRIGDSRNHVHFLHHLVACLICAARYAQAQEAQNELTSMAARLGDAHSLAYSLTSEMALSCFYGTLPVEVFAAKRGQAEAVLASLDDAYLHNYLLAYLGFDKVCRGQVVEANALADQMIAEGNLRNDSRSLGYGTAMKALIALCTDDHEIALQMSEKALSVSRAQWERAIALSSRNASRIPLAISGATEEVLLYLEESERNQWTMMASGVEAMLGVAIVMQGRIGEGVRHLQKVIARRMAEGNSSNACWARLYLCEVYIAVLSGEGGASISVLLRNSLPLLGIILFGPRRIVEMIDIVRREPHFDPEGHYIARAEMIVGLLYKTRKKKPAAIHHLTEALRIVKPAGSSALRTRIEAALSALGASPG